ncbi:MAG: antibiotic biosynthesis monooxygenase [Xanthobacteraceae bacterium]|nr:antibiotic biosynthesis monooxygenase [Xanthobacteraceae bacterium]
MRTLLLTLTLAMPFAAISFAAIPAQAQDATYVVTYIEVAPNSAGQAAGLFKQYADASRKEAGSVRFDALRRIDRNNHFAIVETWKDEKSLKDHTAAASIKKFRDGITPLLSSAYDERPHGSLAVASPNPKIGAEAIYAVTHVDIIPPKKDDGIAATKELAEPSRKENGNLRYDVLQQTSRPNHMTLVETWSNMKAIEGHEVSSHIKKYREALTPMSGSLYDQRLYRVLK